MTPCANCGFNVESTDIFCPSCGHRVGGAAAIVTSAPTLPIVQRPTVRFDDQRISLEAPLLDVIAPPLRDEVPQPPAPRAFADPPASGDDSEPVAPREDDVQPASSGENAVDESDRIPVTLRAPVPGTLCPYCLFGVEESLATCPSCAEAYHGECWSRFGGCAHSHCDRWRLGAGRVAR